MNVVEVMTKICDTGAAAVQRYSYVSGEAPNTMPELFLASFIFDHLGDDYIFTLETTARTLLEWHGHARSRQWLDSPEGQVARASMKGWRVDLVLFESDRPKSEMAIFAPIELKAGWFSDELRTGGRSDLDKLVTLTRHLEGCPYAAMAANMPDWERAKKRERAESRGDIWIERKIDLPAGVPDDHYFCVWLLQRDKGSLASPSDQSAR